MDFLSFVNDFFAFIKTYVALLFNCYIIQGVSLGSIIFVTILLFIIVDALWIRKG